MSMDVLIELDPADAEEVVAALRDKGVEVEDPDEIDSLDGTAIAAFIVTVTPVVAPHIIAVIQALKGKSGKIRRNGVTVELDNYSKEDLEAVLGARADAE